MSNSVQDSNFHNAESICIKGKFPSVLHPLRWAVRFSEFLLWLLELWLLTCSVSLSSTDSGSLPIRNSAREQTGSSHWSCQGFADISRYNISEKMLVCFLPCQMSRKTPFTHCLPIRAQQTHQKQVFCGKNSWISLLILEWVMVAVNHWTAPAV